MHLQSPAAAVGCQLLGLGFEIVVVEDDHVHICNAVQVLVGDFPDSFGLEEFLTFVKCHQFGDAVLVLQAESECICRKAALTHYGLERIAHIPDTDVAVGAGKGEGAAFVEAASLVAKVHLAAAETERAADVERDVI